MEQHTHSTEEVGFEFKKIKIQPDGECLLKDPISLEVEFTSKVDKENAEIELQFIVDCANKKIVIKLASCSQKITVGTNVISFKQAPFTIPESIVKNELTNIGLVSIFIRAGDTELGRITAVTDVKFKDNNFYRIVYNP